ncbi:hypothetical protein BG262_01375 [Floricoccus penangensis]|uniref:DUF2785 domain-containing protein n=1 Tax=Floricoccus penangensis TaxID=1859475 RepID=A0A9Q5P0I5_9LACT|nr:DUF2785 domain-containing protein [Floricoccus penangensis]OFI47011.1 hypothetical protein BG262_01375 [Floricoccus penangensis]
MEEIVKILFDKLERSDSDYTNLEVQCLYEHIGDENPEIRDSLVFISLASGLVEEKFTLEQVKFLAKSAKEEDILFYNIQKGLPYTVTRTFAALLYGFLVRVDGDSNSSYHKFMTESERNYYLNSVLNYLKEEKDFTDFDTKYGWVHGLAHAGDYLGQVIKHPDTNQESILEAFEIVIDIFKKLEYSLSEKEEARLAYPFVEAILENKISQEKLSQLVVNREFPIAEGRRHIGSFAYEKFLAAIYFALESKGILEEKLKIELLNILKEYC